MLLAPRIVCTQRAPSPAFATPRLPLEGDVGKGLSRSGWAKDIGIVADAATYSLQFLRQHLGRVVFWFFCLLLPLWGFAALVGDVHEKEVFPFDAPMLMWLHGIATSGLDQFFVIVSRLGYLWGVVPFDAALLALLIARRRLRDALFFGVAVIGSAALNILAKGQLARARPDLWLSVAPESTYSFPSGHAMGSATLGMACIILCWQTRWRWPVVIVSAIFVLLVALSRMYLGVHYPSDIIAGWAAAIAWTVGIYLLVDQRAPRPPPSAAPEKDAVGGSAGR
ncbi:MAG: phosphatase PAP2 family protein [Gammaproteobacteria bacterium]|nr:phosphatase PAP2 family protein [Gammaproteobacteria bacterium]